MLNKAIQDEQMKPMAMIKEALNHPLVASIGSILIAKVAGIDPALLAGLQGQGEHTSDDMPVDEPENEIFNEAYANFERAGFKPDEIKKLSLWALKNKDIAKSMFQQTQFS